MDPSSAPATTRDRDADQRPRNARPRDGLGRPLEYGEAGVEREPEGVVRSPAETLDAAGRLLADGKPFHAHEVFEDAWKRADEPDRELWRGLAQLAVGVTHAARGNRRGAVALLQRGGDSVSAYRGSAPFGLDVRAVLEWVEQAVAQVERTTPTELPAPPICPPPPGAG